MLLDNHVGLVSGSSKGIGKVVAQRLLEEGATVWITGRDTIPLMKTKNEFAKQYGEKIRSFQGDLTDIKTIHKLLNIINDEWGRLDFVVANIGSGKSRIGWDVDDSIWEDTMITNFYGAVRLSREAIRMMKERKSGSIVFISSIAGVESIEAPVPYSTAKAALLMYMKSTSRIVAKMGIRMNAISPGNVLFEGGTWENKLINDQTNVEKYIQREVPMASFASPIDIAEGVIFLVSQKGSFINGANLIIDGGQTRSL